MAGTNGNIVIRFVTEYSGKGAKLLKDAMTSTGRIVTKSMNTMAGAFGDLADIGNEKIGSVIRGFGQLGQALSQGGVWGLAAFGVQKIVGMIGEMMETAKENAKALSDFYKDAFVKSIDSVSDSYRKMGDAIGTALKREKELAAEQKAAADRQSAVSSYQINEARRRAVAGGADAGVAGAQAALAKARQGETQQIVDADAAKKAAKDEARAARQRVTVAELELESAKEGVENAKRATAKANLLISTIEQYMRDAEDDNARGEFARAIKDIRDEYSAQFAALDKAESYLKTATDNLAKRREEAASAESNIATVEQKTRADAWKAMDARREAEERLAAEQKREAKEAREKANKAELDAQARREEQEAENEAESRAAMAEALEDLADQDKKRLMEMKPALERLNASVDSLSSRLKKANEHNEWLRRGREADARHTNGLFGPYEYGGRSGGSDNFIDFARAERFAQRADRDAEKAMRRDAAQRRKYDDLLSRERDGQTLSNRDRAFMKQWERFQDARDGAKNLQQQLEAKQKARDELQKKMRDLLKSIDENLKAALALG